MVNCDRSRLVDTRLLHLYSMQLKMGAFPLRRFPMARGQGGKWITSLKDEEDEFLPRLRCTLCSTHKSRIQQIALGYDESRQLFGSFPNLAVIP